jgi:hypothetical protein
VTRDRLWLVKFLQVLLFFLSQRLPSNINRLVNSLNATEPNNRTANPLIDPSQSNMGHFPAPLLSNLLHSLYGLGINLAETLLKLRLTTGGCTESFNWTSEMATSERCPLILLADIRY